MNETTGSIGCVIMASGLAKRFGSNKLLALFGGRPLLCRTFDATDTPLLTGRIIVTRSAEVEQLCGQYGIPCLRHTLPGRNDTVRLGLEALLTRQPALAGCMFLPGDQPLLRRESVERVIEASRDPARSQKETERAAFRLAYQSPEEPDPLVGSPVLFTRGFFSDLRTLPEGKGGSFLLRNEPEQVHLVLTAHREELLDADTPEALRELEALVL